MIRFAVLAALCIAATARAAIDDRVPGAAPPDIRYRDDRIVLRLEPDAAARLHAVRAAGGAHRTGLAALDRTADRLGVRRFSPEFAAEGNSPLAAFWIADLPPGSDPAAAAAELARLDGVAEAFPIAIVPVATVPNDSLWSLAAHLYQPTRRDVHALEAWDVTRGDSAIVLAVIDTGVLLDHPDLAGQLWRNDAERGGQPGIDDDGNGYVDDHQGWDFVALASDDDIRPFEDWRHEDNDPNDFAGHGTAVSGVAAARTNNGIGVAGLAWDIRIMPLRVGWSTQIFSLGVIDLSYAARAVEYAAANGAAVINCSFSTTAAGDLLAAVDAAIAAGVVVVFSAGNNGTPAAVSQLPGVVSVASTDPNDVVTQFSNVHPTVALSAPGLSLPTTFIAHAGGDSASDRQPTYTTGASGTSFSAPLAAAAAALVQSHRRVQGLPPLAPLDMKLLLMETTDAIDTRNTARPNYGTGRLNTGRALTEGLRSFHVRAGGRAVGPALLIPALRGEIRMAFAMDTGEILFIGGTSRDTLARMPLAAPPEGTMAAADPGLGFGTAIWIPCADGRIHAYDLRGRPVPGWPVPATGITDFSWSAPALGDLDGDGAVEIVWGGNDGRVYAWHADGTAVDGFPRVVATPGPNLVVALADLDGTAGMEIVAGAANGTVASLDSAGAMRPGWPQQHLFAVVDMMIADVDPSPGPEIVVAGGSVIRAWTPGGAGLFSRTFPVYVSPGIAAADLDGDGTSEIVVAMIDRVAVLGGGGVAWPGFPKLADGLVSGPPVVGGITGLTQEGILIACTDGANGHRLRGFTTTSVRVARYPLPGGAGQFPVLAELDGDDATEIVAGTGTGGSLWVYDAGAGTWREPAWPEPGGSSARTRSRLGPPTMSPYDDVAPDPVSDLVAERRSPTRVAVRWTQVADEGPAGRPERYEVAAFDRPFEPEEFDDSPWRREVDAADGVMEVELDGLSAGIGYWFAVRSSDAAGNVSAMSALAMLEQRGPLIARGVRIASTRNPAAPPVTLSWLAAGDVPQAARSVRIYDLTGRLLARRDASAGYEGTVVWDGRDRSGRPSPPGLYFARFVTASHSGGTRFALVR